MPKKSRLTSSLGPEPREALEARQAHEDHLHLRQDRVVPGLLSCQNAPQVTLVSGSHVRQAERHANVAVWQALAAFHARRLEALLRCDSAEPWVVDADVQPAILAWMGSYTG